MTRRSLFWFRWGVFAAACAFLYVRLARHQGMHGAFLPWGAAGTAPSWGLLATVGLGMVLNWALEARKWQALMRPVEPLPFSRAFTATLAGTTIGLITPNRVGEFAGRVLFLDPGHRVQGSFATLLGSIAQFVVTLLVGGIAVMAGGQALFRGILPAPVGAAVVWSALLIGCVAVFLYFSPGAFARLLLAIPWLRRFERHAHVLDAMDRHTLVGVFVLSLLRYAVFTLQFALLVQAMGTLGLSAALFSVPVVFLVTTLVPTTALTELGIRGSVAAAIIPGEEAGIVAATALIWLINLVLPALVGGVILLVARIRTSKEGA